MNFKRLCLLVFLIIFSFSNFVFANIEENENINLDEIKQNIIETSTNSSTIPDINSRSAVVIDRHSKTVLYGKNEQDIRKMASTTKIMTAIVVIENSNLYDTVVVSKKASATGGSTLGIKEGDKITVCDLLYGLLLKSGNDTAVALAEHVSGSVEQFAVLMNKKAQELGLTNTNFVTPHGLDDDNHYTTAYELALLTNYALNNQTFTNFVGTKIYTIKINNIPKTISNTNELLGNLNGVYGVKTGFTNGANRCLVTACKRDNLDIICVVLGADTKKIRTQDSIKLIDYIYKTYEIINLRKLVEEDFTLWKSKNENIFSVNKGITNKIDLEIKDFNLDLYPIRKEYKSKLTTSIICNHILNAPINANSPIGQISINIGDNKVLNYDIVNKNIVKKKNCLIYLKDFISNYFKYLTTIV